MEFGVAAGVEVSLGVLAGGFVLLRLTKGEKKQNALEDLAHQFWPVVDGSSHVPRENPVELSRVHPRVLDVVDFETDVGRDKLCLGG